MPEKPSEIVGRVLKDFTADSKAHDHYARQIDGWYRDWRGIVDKKSRASDWQSDVAPKYAFQIVETLTANVIDPSPRWKVRPRPRMEDGQSLARYEKGARANELLLAEQVDCDHFAQKQVAFAKQAFIAGCSVYKTFWNYAERDVVQQQVVNELDPETGVIVPRLRRGKQTRVLADDPTAEVVDMRDFIPHEGATCLERALRVTHRVWYTFDELKRLEAQGVYGQQAGGESVDKLKDSRDYTAQASEREQDIFQTDRTKDKVEVLEQWRRQPDGSIRVVTVGNRSVLLRDVPSPFGHGEFPFVVCAPIPDATARIQGVSVIELVTDLQSAAWSFLRQRLDNTELLNNAVVLIRDDVDDLDQFEWAPGAQWIVQDPTQVSLLQVNPLPAQVSIQAEEKLKEDLQNIPGASPTLLGQTDAGTQTATEVSLSTSLAQRRIALVKQNFKWAAKRVGEQWISLNQQFVSNERLVAVVGADGAEAFQSIHPLLLQGSYFINLDSMDESLMRQERLAEAQARLQVAGSMAPIFAALPNQPGLNMQAYMDDVLDAAGILDKQKYYTATPQPQLAEGAPGQAPPQQGAPQAQPQQGLTAPQAYDMNSPSNAVSQSPMAAMQRLGSMAGGPVNA